MKKIIIYSAMAIFLAACSNANNDEKSNSDKKEESGTSISISPDSVGITTKNGDKLEIHKDDSLPK